VKVTLRHLLIVMPSFHDMISIGILSKGKLHWGADLQADLSILNLLINPHKRLVFSGTFFWHFWNDGGGSRRCKKRQAPYSVVRKRAQSLHSVFPAAKQLGSIHRVAPYLSRQNDAFRSMQIERNKLDRLWLVAGVIFPH
jgi:hypothetical protein